MSRSRDLSAYMIDSDNDSEEERSRQREKEKKRRMLMGMGGISFGSSHSMEVSSAGAGTRAVEVNRDASPPSAPPPNNGGDGVTTAAPSPARDDQKVTIGIDISCVDNNYDAQKERHDASDECDSYARHLAASPPYVSSVPSSVAPSPKAHSRNTSHRQLDLSQYRSTADEEAGGDDFNNTQRSTASLRAGAGGGERERLGSSYRDRFEAMLAAKAAARAQEEEEREEKEKIGLTTKDSTTANSLNNSYSRGNDPLLASLGSGTKSSSYMPQSAAYQAKLEALLEARGLGASRASSNLLKQPYANSVPAAAVTVIGAFASPTVPQQHQPAASTTTVITRTTSITMTTTTTPTATKIPSSSLNNSHSIMRKEGIPASSSEAEQQQQTTAKEEQAKGGGGIEVAMGSIPPPRSTKASEEQLNEKKYVNASTVTNNSEKLAESHGEGNNTSSSAMPSVSASASSLATATMITLSDSTATFGLNNSTQASTTTTNHTSATTTHFYSLLADSRGGAVAADGSSYADGAAHAPTSTAEKAKPSVSAESCSTTTKPSVHVVSTLEGNTTTNKTNVASPSSPTQPPARASLASIIAAAAERGEQTKKISDAAIMHTCTNTTSIQLSTSKPPLVVVSKNSSTTANTNTNNKFATRTPTASYSYDDDDEEEDSLLRVGGSFNVVRQEVRGGEGKEEGARLRGQRNPAYEPTSLVIVGEGGENKFDSEPHHRVDDDESHNNTVSFFNNTHTMQHNVSTDFEQSLNNTLSTAGPHFSSPQRACESPGYDDFGKDSNTLAMGEANIAPGSAAASVRGTIVSTTGTTKRTAAQHHAALQQPLSHRNLATHNEHQHHRLSVPAGRKSASRSMPRSDGGDSAEFEIPNTNMYGTQPTANRRSRSGHRDPHDPHNYTYETHHTNNNNNNTAAAITFNAQQVQRSASATRDIKAAVAAVVAPISVVVGVTGRSASASAFSHRDSSTAMHSREGGGGGGGGIPFRSSSATNRRSRSQRSTSQFSQSRTAAAFEPNAAEIAAYSPQKHAVSRSQQRMFHDPRIDAVHRNVSPLRTSNNSGGLTYEEKVAKVAMEREEKFAQYMAERERQAVVEEERLKALYALANSSAPPMRYRSPSKYDTVAQRAEEARRLRDQAILAKRAQQEGPSVRDLIEEKKAKEAAEHAVRQPPMKFSETNPTAECEIARMQQRRALEKLASNADEDLPTFLRTTTASRVNEAMAIEKRKAMGNIMLSEDEYLEAMRERQAKKSQEEQAQNGPPAPTDQREKVFSNLYSKTTAILKTRAELLHKEKESQKPETKPRLLPGGTFKVSDRLLRETSSANAKKTDIVCFLEKTNIRQGSTATAVGFSHSAMNSNVGSPLPSHSGLHPTLTGLSHASSSTRGSSNNDSNTATAATSGHPRDTRGGGARQSSPPPAPTSDSHDTNHEHVESTTSPTPYHPPASSSAAAASPSGPVVKMNAAMAKRAEANRIKLEEERKKTAAEEQKRAKVQRKAEPLLSFERLQTSLNGSKRF